MRKEPNKQKSLKRVALRAGVTVSAPNPYPSPDTGASLNRIDSMSIDDYNSAYSAYGPAPQYTDHVGLYTVDSDTDLFVFLTPITLN